MIKNTLKYVSCKDYKAVTVDLKIIYKSVSRMWKNNWEHISILFAYTNEIRKVIYTINAIKSLNSVIRKDVFLAIKQAPKKWTVPIRNWKPALNRFKIKYVN